MKKLIIANLKMNQNATEAKLYFTKLVAGFTSQKCDLVVCPSYVALPIANYLTVGSPIKLGAQDVSDEENGAHTGEISASMLKDIGAEYVIVGHSERRTKFKESDKLINKKIKFALKYRLKCVLCIGESLADRNSGKTYEILKKQLDEDLRGLYENELESVVIAYEPVWAIGTGNNASVKDVELAARQIRKVVYENFSEKASRDIQVVYGGSLNEKNYSALISASGIDGGLFGGSSLSVNSFLNMINSLK